MKRCWGCKETLSLDRFSKNSNLCKSCASEYHKKWLLIGEHAKKCSNRFKEWVKENKSRDDELHQTWRKNNWDKYLESHRVGQLKYASKNPEKIAAQQLAGRNRKRLIKEFCEDCGSNQRLEMHHPDYSQPLKVITLCHKCHLGYTLKEKTCRTNQINL